MHVFCAESADCLSSRYLGEIRARGWHLIDHTALDTVALHGEWYPTILDACIFSLSTGLVGTKRSTSELAVRRRAAGDGIADAPISPVTLLAQRRAQTWHPLFMTSAVDL